MTITIQCLRVCFYRDQIHAFHALLKLTLIYQKRRKNNNEWIQIKTKYNDNVNNKPDVHVTLPKRAWNQGFGAEEERKLGGRDRVRGGRGFRGEEGGERENKERENKERVK